ncbi:MAG: hypothetical protein E2O82_00295 [Betaproteobacteria bacterium]|nr:MAG: hypothetical protein E2O82_00295 [Betaproteobacteria bacterium]
MAIVHLNAVIIFLFCIGLDSTLFLASAVAAPFELPPVQKGTNLADCKTKLEKQGGGWCEIRLPGKHPSISSVWPPNLDSRTHMISGPESVLTAWNGAAFDEKNLLLYFMGGGHSDYGGNEVYEFDLKTGHWKRLTDPSPLTFLFQIREATPTKTARYCWGPDMRRVPGSTHTYDGMQFSKKTKTIFLVPDEVATGSCFDDKEGRFDGDPRVLFGRDTANAIYEFNPSRHKIRNGLAPLTWRRLTTPQGLRLEFPRSLELPDGTMMVGNPWVLYPFDPSSGAIGKQLWPSEADHGDGLAEFHPMGFVMSQHGETLILINLQTGATERITTPRFHGKSLAVDKSGSVFSWDGRHRILVINLHTSERKWSLYDWSGAGPPSGDHRVYSKWQYIAAHDVFVGLSSHTTGVWVYKHPATMPGVELSRINLESLIDKAKPGSVVIVPPGFYGQGLFIYKSLTVKLKDVRLWGVAEDKGIINVDCDGCTVVIEDFYGEGHKAGCLDYNCAGIKVEGNDFHLTVRRAHIDNTVMGILTDNRGGQLVVEDSLIENTGLNDQSDTLGHGLYAGTIDSLILRRSTIRNVNSYGHTLKSRAKETILKNVRLLGDQGFHSRSIDMPCGGTLRMTNSIIQHGVNSDNNDLIALGAESENCEIYPSRAFITKNWIINDRAKGADGNILFHWFTPLTMLELKDNHIVNLDKWSSSNAKSGEIEIADHSLHNKLCQDRAACDLAQDQLPVP